MHTIGRRTDAAPPSASAAPLDPDDWEAMRRLGHRMVDDMLRHLEKVADGPVWQQVPTEVADRFATTLPEIGIGAEAAYEEFLQNVFPYPVGNTHPRFWGWVLGSGTPAGVLAELLAAAMNPNVSGLRSAAVNVERQVVTWLSELLGYPAGASGLLVSGGSVANLVGLAAGVIARAGFDVARRGWAAAPRPPVAYASSQTHFSVEKAVRTLGLGTDQLRRIPVDDQYRIELGALEAAIRRDRRDGLEPVLVVGNAGTVNTGAFDDLEALAELARREELWFHVDGAFGAFAALDAELAPLTRGMERADSLAFDLHKWLLVPIEAGAVLVRDVGAHRAAFAVGGDYVGQMPGGIGRDSTYFAERGPQLTRGFKALKVWFSLKAHGAAAYADLVRRNVAQARHLASRVRTTAGLQLMAPVPLNVVNYRYTVPGWSDERLDALNRDLVVRLQEDGIAAPSHTRLNGRFTIRACITNHRTRDEDLDLLVQETVRLGSELVGRGQR